MSCLCSRKETYLESYSETQYDNTFLNSCMRKSENKKILTFFEIDRQNLSTLALINLLLLGLLL